MLSGITYNSSVMLFSIVLDHCICPPGDFNERFHSWAALQACAINDVCAGSSSSSDGSLIKSGQSTALLMPVP
jgi:hypothetical protein